MAQFGLGLQAPSLSTGPERRVRAQHSAGAKVYGQSIAALLPPVFIRVHPWLICLFIYAHLRSAISCPIFDGCVHLKGEWTDNAYEIDYKS